VFSVPAHVRETDIIGLRAHVRRDCITLSRFCQLCIFKYFLNNQKACPLCRQPQSQAIEELSVNRIMDELSKKISPQVTRRLTNLSRNT